MSVARAMGGEGAGVREQESLTPKRKTQEQTCEQTIGRTINKTNRRPVNPAAGAEDHAQRSINPEG